MRRLLICLLFAGCVAESDDPDSFGSSASSSSEGEDDEGDDEGVSLEEGLAQCDAAMVEESAACEEYFHGNCVVEMQDDPCCEGDPDFATFCEPYPCHVDPEHETPYCRLPAPSGCGENLCRECMRACDDDPDCDIAESGWECVADLVDYS